MATPHIYKVNTFRGSNGRWYWRMTARNGKIVADGSQGYGSRSAAKNAGARMIAAQKVLVQDDPV